MNRNFWVHFENYVTMLTHSNLNLLLKQAFFFALFPAMQGNGVSGNLSFWPNFLSFLENSLSLDTKSCDFQQITLVLGENVANHSKNAISGSFINYKSKFILWNLPSWSSKISENLSFATKSLSFWEKFPWVLVSLSFFLREFWGKLRKKSLD